MIVSRYALMTILFLALFVSISLAHSSNSSVGSFFDLLKYISLIAFSVAFFLLSRSYRVDFLSLCGYLFFCFFTLFFTLINEPDPQSLLVIFGYFILFLVWVSAQSSMGANWAIGFFRDKIYLVCIFHLTLSILYFFDANAYTVVKGQYMGYMRNPNAYAGVTGILLVLTLSQLKFDQRSKSAFQFVIIGFLGVFLVLAGSRAALLCTFLAFLCTNIKMKFKVSIAVAGLGMAAFIYLGAVLDGLVGQNALNRDLMENTGRGEILQGYLYQLIERSLFFGTGLSELGGRIKSELAYVDALLFSGVGALGLFLFIIMGLVHSFKASRAGFTFMFPTMIYVFTLSFFEGYLSNVMAVPTVVFYIFHGVSYFLSRRALTA